MRTISHGFCGVIPPHILTRLAEQSDTAIGNDARSTLAQMRDLARDRIAAALTDNTAAAATVALKKRRNVYDAGHKTKLPGRLALSEHKPRSRDVEVNEAYDGSGAAFDFFAQVFGRNSIDDRSLRLDSSVHYATRFDNAVWTGRQMVYGDGDGHLFNRFTASLEVIGHELTHGVTQYTAALGYTGENGALN